jgi:hypothetical protein
MVTCQSISVPPTGSVVVFQATPDNASVLSIRNTGATGVLLGSDDLQAFPLNAGEFIGMAIETDDTLFATGNGFAGTLTVLGVG